ncbi:MAG: hypothetical protein V3V78_05030 [Candidatus Woesearchaeota archaeon]
MAKNKTLDQIEARIIKRLGVREIAHEEYTRITGKAPEEICNHAQARSAWENDLGSIIHVHSWDKFGSLHLYCKLTDQQCPVAKEGYKEGNLHQLLNYMDAKKCPANKE